MRSDQQNGWIMQKYYVLFLAIVLGVGLSYTGGASVHASGLNDESGQNPSYEITNGESEDGKKIPEGQSGLPEAQSESEQGGLPEVQSESGQGGLPEAQSESGQITENGLQKELPDLSGYTPEQLLNMQEAITEQQPVYNIAELTKAVPTVTDSANYTAVGAVQGGMSRSFDHPLYNMKIEYVSHTISWDTDHSTAVVTLKYTFTPKESVGYMLAFVDGFTDSTASGDKWKDAAGQDVDFGAGALCSAGSVYTCTRNISMKQGNAAGSHYANVHVNVILGEDVLSYTHNEFDYAIAPAVMQLSNKANVEADKSSITVKGLQAEGTITLFYKAESDKTWKTMKANADVANRIKGLKSNTAYQVKIQSTVSDKNRLKNAVTLVSAESNVLTLKTALKQKPIIQSVTISNAKYKKQKVKGYFNTSGQWTPGYRNYYTSFQVKVKLAKKIKGAKGICFTVNGKEYKMSGSKKEYTIKASSRGNIVGKAILVKAYSYNNADGIGCGPVSNSEYVKVKK